MGPGVINGLAGELKALGIARPMLISGKRTRHSILFERALTALGEYPHVLSEPIPAHSDVNRVEALVRQAIAQGVDGFVAIGGGSASDTAKAVSLLMAEGGKLADHATRFTPPSTLVRPALLKPKLPIVAIVGTASGAEVTPSLGIRSASGGKLLFSDPQLSARLVLIDPKANLAMPAAIMCATGMNGLAHCIEGLYSKERSPLAETLALEAMRRFAQALPTVHQHPNDPQARADLLYAAHLSGLVLVHARTCLHHAICHAIGSFTGMGYGIAHGMANSVMLPHAVAFNASAAAKALAAAAVHLSVGQDADALLTWLRALQLATGVPTRLRDLGLRRDALATIANKTMEERGLYFNPRVVDNVADIEALLDAAF